MNKKELTEAIEDGILGAVGKFSLCIVAAFLIVLLSVGVITLYFNSQSNQPSNITNVGAPSPSCFPYNNVVCSVFVGNGTDTAHIFEFSICGYQEANAKFITLKPIVEDYMKDFKWSGWEVKRLWCN